jgi:prepilin signal peptidase PulO-like enzyme (type II secretory pathway)
MPAISAFFFVTIVFTFALGAVFASFFNVFIEVFLAGGSWLAKKRSTCEYCGKVLGWWELIPILGFVMLRGRCRKCRKSISMVHPLSELFLGGAFVLIFLLSDNYWTVLFRIVVTLILYFFSVVDIKSRKVPNAVLYPILVGAALISIFFSPASRFLGALIYFSFIALVNLVTYLGVFPGIGKGKFGFGWGDAKFALFLGLCLGLPATIVSLIITIFAGGIFGAILIIASKIQRKSISGTKLPYVPLMALGTWVAMMWGVIIFDALSYYLLIY